MGLAALARQEGVTVERMQQALAGFEQQYRDSAEASGPTKWPRFAGKQQLKLAVGRRLANKWAVAWAVSKWWLATGQWAAACCLPVVAGL